MTRLGTCAFAYQIQAITHIPVHSHPHLRPQIELCPEAYVCAFFAHEDLPPPLQRVCGSFVIQEDDCEVCPYFVPAGEKQLIRALRKKAASRRRRRAKISQG